MRTIGKRHRAVAGLAALALLTGSSGLAGCDPGTVATASVLLGNKLDDLTTGVQGVIAGAGLEARGLVTQTGSQVLQVIDQARIAFEGSLSTAVDKVDEATHARLNQIEQLVAEFTADAFGKATALQSQAQQLILTLPFANGQPQVRSWTPHFVSGRETVSVVVDGIFTQSQQPGSTPRLAMGGTTITPDTGANTTQRLVFVVPAAAFPAGAADAVTPVSAALTVPYHSPILRTDKTATYRLLLGVLPASPGRITLTRLVRQSVHEQQSMRSAQLHQQGAEDGTPPEDGHVTNDYCTDAIQQSGWRIAAGGLRFVLDNQAGGPERGENIAWTKKYLHVGNSDRQCVRVWTKSYSKAWIGGWHSGDIDFHLEWTIEGTRELTTWTVDAPMSLQWGERKVFDLPSGEWKIRYEPFRGAPVEINEAVRTEWVTVAQAPRSVSVSVIGADAVRF